MRLRNKFALLSTESMNAIKEGKEDLIPEKELELAKEWYANLEASKNKPKKETVLENKELEKDGEN